MKKVKIMLASIAVLTVVGGALAFKAKSGDILCYRQDKAAQVCNLVAEFSATDPGDAIFYTTVQSQDECLSGVACSSIAETVVTE